jgi:septum formation protein
MELLQQLVPEFLVEPAWVDEDALTCKDPWATAQRIAREKAQFVYQNYPHALVIAGDTVVALEGEENCFRLFGKPRDGAEAVEMLQELSGKTHLVVTGLVLRWPKGLCSFTETSEVTFRPISRQEISGYVATGEPMDKAGAYGIQGGAAAFVDRVEGSYTNVVGLPMEALEEALLDLN